MNPTRLPDEFWRDDNIFEDEYDSESGETARHIYSVSQLNRDIRLILEDNFTPVWVEGEVSGLRVPASGHCYFTLKDEQSQLKAVVFRREFRALRHPLREGDRIICSGRISLYEPRGEYQVIITSIEPKGLGDLWRAFNELKEKLEKDGLFAPERKKRIPFLPRRIAVVTSATGAAIRDVLQIVRRRFAGVEGIIFPVSVQGERAPSEIIAAFRRLSEKWGRGVDTVILTRGGGAYEDLVAFNDEGVARAVAECAIPVISAVGHEIDFTIVDFVADLRAPTPSAAAELAVPDRRELEERLRQLRQRLLQNGRFRVVRERRRLQLMSLALERTVDAVERQRHIFRDLEHRFQTALTARFRLLRQELGNYGRQLERASPLVRTTAARKELEYLTQRSRQAIRHNLEREHERLQALYDRLKSASPRAVMERGYAVVEKSGRSGAVSDSSELTPGDRLDLTFARGRARAMVEEVFPATGK
jgi:exodeoxyribonuclease VII large subunit